MQDFQDKVAVVTGGGSGIGHGICLALAAQGTNVVVADIDADNAAKVAEEVSGKGARGGVTELSMRGLEANQVVVLVDGVRLNDPLNSRGGSFDPTTLSLASIERVEVVRGPFSSLYGSDAVGGVVQQGDVRAALAGEAAPVSLEATLASARATLQAAAALSGDPAHGA